MGVNMIRSEWMDPKRSLKDKYSEVYQNLKQNPLRSFKMPSESQFEKCDRVGAITPLWILSTIVAGIYIVGYIFLPVNYEDVSTIFYHRIYIGFMIAEILVNGTMAKCISSLYESNEDVINNIGPQAEYSLTYNAPHAANEDVTILIGGNVQGSNGKTVCKERNGWTSMLVQVASLDEVARGISRRENFPYWSWKPCTICKHQRPPRSHHCPLCNKCVLKRDHHCYFTNSCIGVNNQRYFAVLIFWSFQATAYALYHAILYLPPDARYVDIIPPIACIRWLLGYIEGYRLILFICLFSIAFILIQCTALVIAQVTLVLRGSTAFEEQQRFKIINTNNIITNIRAVFGDYPLLSFFVPLYGIIPNKEDGLTWPNIKM